MKKIILLLYSMIAYAAPEGFELISGQATPPQIDLQGQIHVQSTKDSVVHWNGFSLNAQETLIFDQARETSCILNRVVGSNPSEILGKLQSNGVVYLINQNGILIGPNGIIETAGFLASTLDVLTQDFFTKNTLEFFSQNPGSIINLGTISCPIGQITLLAHHIENQGELIGSVQAVACAKAILQIDNQRVFIQTSQKLDTPENLQALNASLQKNPYAHAIKHSGRIKSNTLSKQNGRVLLFAQEGTTEVTGIIEASDIKLLGKEVLLKEQALVDASSDVQGGKIVIGGGYKGQDPNIPLAEHVLIDKQVQIHADALQTGDGGEIILWSKENTEFLGSLSAKGGAEAGNGGFSEVSGKKGLSFEGKVDLRAINGKTGNLLIDPDNINIISTGTDSATGQTFATTGTVNISGFDIGLAIDAANLTMQANYDISIQDNISATTPGNGLTLQAGGRIYTNSGSGLTIALNGGSFSATFNDSGATNPGGISTFTGDRLTINTNEGNILIQQGSLANLFNGRIYLLNNTTLDAGSGSVELAINPNNDYLGAAINLQLSTINAGNIILNGTGDEQGILLDNSNIKATEISATGVSKAGAFAGIDLNLSIINAGNVILNGTGNAGGVLLDQTVVNATAINATGVSKASALGGIQLTTSALNASTGAIVLTGQGEDSSGFGIALGPNGLINAMSNSVTLNSTLGSIALNDGAVFCGGGALTVNSQEDCILLADQNPTQMLVSSGIANFTIRRDLTLTSGANAGANAIIGTGNTNIAAGSLQFDVGRNVSLTSTNAQTYSLIGYGNLNAPSNVTGDIAFNHVGGDVTLQGANSGTGAAGFAQIGHLSGAGGSNTLDGNISLLVDGSISVMGGSASNGSYAQIGHGGDNPFTTTGELTAIAGKNITLQSSTGPANIINEGGNVTLVTDNLFPTSPSIGPGFFSSSAGSNLLSSGEMRIYTAVRSQNQINGLIN
ncbi:MAG: filamentous hemagglutinin N-terminal domain-containing protein, partial [Candidatus Rhabdochlamydia sp.]